MTSIGGKGKATGPGRAPTTLRIVPALLLRRIRGEPPRNLFPPFAGTSTTHRGYDRNRWGFFPVGSPGSVFRQETTSVLPPGRSCRRRRVSDWIRRQPSPTGCPAHPGRIQKRSLAHPVKSGDESSRPCRCSASAKPPARRSLEGGKYVPGRSKTTQLLSGEMSTDIQVPCSVVKEISLVFPRGTVMSHFS